MMHLELPCLQWYTGSNTMEDIEKHLNKLFFQSFILKKVENLDTSYLFHGALCIQE